MCMSVLQYPTDRNGIKNVSGFHDYLLTRCIDELASMSLVEQSITDQLSSVVMLPLTQLFARSQLSREPALEEKVLSKLQEQPPDVGDTSDTPV